MGKQTEVEKEVYLDEEDLKTMIGLTVKEALAEKKEPKEKVKKDEPEKKTENPDMKDQISEAIKAALADIKIPSKMEFPGTIKEQGEKHHFGEMLKAINDRNFYHLKKYDLKPVDSEGNTKVLVEGTQNLGGYLVPDEYSKKIIDLAVEWSVVRPLCTIVPMKGKTIHLTSIEDSGQTYWVDENGTKPESDMEFGQLTINAYKLIRLQKITKELLEDSDPAVEALLMGIFARTLANAEDRAFLIGTGGPGDPITGIQNQGGVNILPSGAALTFDDVFDATGVVEANNGMDIDILYQPRDKKTLRKLKGADGQYLWSSASAGAPGTIDGYNAYKDGNIPRNLGPGNNQSLMFVGDFNYAYIGDRQGVVISSGLDSDDFSRNRISFLAEKRVGFALADPAKFAVITGILPT